MKLEEYIAAIIYLEDKYSGKLKDYWTRIRETIPEKLVKISQTVATEEYVEA